MKYVIIGAGPTGLSLAHVLANNGYEVDIIERDSQLGGSCEFTVERRKVF